MDEAPPLTYIECTYSRMGGWQWKKREKTKIMGKLVNALHDSETT